MSNHLEDLKEIKTLMQKSTKFISLSGLSGVFAGIYALIGAYVAYQYLELYDSIRHLFTNIGLQRIANKFVIFLLLDATLILFLSIATSVFLTYRKVKQNKENIFSPTAIRLIINIMIPLTTGGIFSLILLSYGLIGLIAPSMLIFYGLALVNASQYTLRDIRYLGYLEIFTGIVSMLDIGNGLFYWSFGFGVLHIIYGSYMYFKYEYKQHA